MQDKDEGAAHNKQPAASTVEDLRVSIWNDLGRYTATRDRAPTNNTLSRIQDVVGFGSFPGKQSPRDDYWNFVRTLIIGTDSFDMDEAAGTARACKRLWPSPDPDATSPFKADKLYHLAQGLRSGAMAFRSIHESLYGAFILNFCFIYEVYKGSQHRAYEIQRAYCMAVPRSGQNLPDFANPMSGIVRILELLQKSGAPAIKTLESARSAERKDFCADEDLGHCDLKSRIDKISRSVDYSFVASHLRSIMQDICTNSRQSRKHKMLGDFRNDPKHGGGDRDGECFMNDQVAIDEQLAREMAERHE